MATDCTTDPENGRHAWEATGLDNIEAERLRPRVAGASGAVLCTTRQCTWCGRQEAKPYGHGGERPWRHVVAPGGAR